MNYKTSKVMSEQCPSFVCMILCHSLFYSCNAVMPCRQVSIVRPRLPEGKSLARGRGVRHDVRTHLVHFLLCQVISPGQRTCSVGTKHVCRDRVTHGGIPVLPRSFLLKCTRSNKNKPAGSGMKSECGGSDRSGVAHPADLHDDLRPAPPPRCSFTTPQKCVASSQGPGCSETGGLPSQGGHCL